MALRPETPFKKYHGKSAIYSLPYATEADLAQTTFRPSAGEDERFSKTLEAQLQGAIRAHARSTPSSYVVFDPTSLVAVTVAGAGLTVQASGTEAFTQETYARQKLKPSGWSGLDSMNVNYLWVAPVEEDTSTGRYRSTLEKGDMDFRSTLTADPPEDGACLIATWQSGVGFNLNPTGKAYSENVKAHREKSTDPHGATLTQGHVEVTNLRVINFDIEGAVTFEGPETHTPTSTPTFQDTADLDTGRFDAPVQSSAPFNLDSGVPIDGRDPSADFPQLLDGSTLDATKHRHRSVVPAEGALNIPATFPGGWAANKATVAGDVPAWGDYPPVNYANYFSFGNSTLLWPVAQVYSPTLKYDGDSGEGVDNLDLAQSGVFTEGMITDLSGKTLPALGMRTDIPASIELSARVFLPARFKTLKSIDFWHRHANPANTAAFRDAKVTVKTTDSLGADHTLALLEISQPWTHKVITPVAGTYSPETFVNFLISGEWPTGQESGIQHFISDIRLTYETNVIPIT